MNYYIATRLENHEMHNKIRDLIYENLKSWDITYDWTVHGSVKHEGVACISEVCMKEITGVLEADVVIVLLPGGRGTHTELGIAIGEGTPVFILADKKYGFFAQDERTCAFYYAPMVRRIEGDIEDLIKALKEFNHKVITKGYYNTLLGE
jgi:hypothetical protein